MEKIFIGVDISKKTLDCAIYDKETVKMRGNLYRKVSNDESGYKEMISWIKSIGIKQVNIHVCMEHTGIYGYDFALYLEDNKIVYSMVSGFTIKRSGGMQRGKDDKIDAIRIATYANRFGDTLQPTVMRGSIMMKLRDLTNDRKLLVKQAAEHKSVIEEHKKHPESSRYKRSKEIVKSLQVFINEVEQEILELINSDEDIAQNYSLITSITGIANVNAVNTIVATNNFKSFSNARQYASFLGIAPYTVKSGTSVNKGTHVSKMGNKRLKADLSQAAKSALMHSPEIKAYYMRKRAEGKSFGSVLNAIKFKLVEYIFAVVKRQTPFVPLMNHIA